MNNSKFDNRPQRIIIFTRYPQPGKVKTRLIAHLGAAGAARIHKEMTEQLIHRIEPDLPAEDTILQIFYSGASLAQMQQWLGKSCSFIPQQGDGLGQRMKHAFADADRPGRTILIGSDCPEVDTAIIRTGLEKLTSHDLVLGPAADGGYYLIGLKRPATPLFDDIDWGTGRVLAQTLVKAESLGLTIALLPVLHDIDRPEDLVHYRGSWHEKNLHYHPGTE